ncbi:MAG: hypothetical protein A3H69_05780 [Candidatus Sungbacteria bacterium RIFCSPLOWO2_02_FULL_47_9]|uniref:ABC transporter domain-containing protein n=1 Tax=Candidatus Sungbacteria bacterium RIFCSPHIGHO2_01_FULL_47_32 TaxID=1802264 RepID=A0A1G2K2D7_9BACT|nr:MAG: hypothetical protein UX72_C0017G0051 [Parcubacteria group bacterium GW2011_GWA2_47_10]OGZ93599.1 MAG: hypothetical protein A2633_04555 [Candidatus Sungbacteria bacterium RIFCSPHIGHO2_01_FULL_47_32]OHA05441.1 MAG: hypothetical protein A3A28_03015 [Candidatus Sungbacteria bacterium RIFCSPLOWO2_01_FULL_47_32]OHA08658.1 MAG: hypothetical protein A3H69_05780 [Candidatus Sungbacteria bacterium RIFCSPLOWO2_02_FULL_47_9]
MSRGELIVRFEKVSFGYRHTNPLLTEVDFTIRRGAKLTLMGQNGAGKSTIFQLVTGAIKPDSGLIHIAPDLTTAVSRQVVSRDQREFTVREFFEKCFENKVYDIDPKINAVLKVVNLKAEHERKIKSFSGGQQARLLLASALIQDPDLLLLDEPTNNLDKAGIAHLTDFLINYKKSCIVISHDADFLNAFTEGVLYLSVYTKKIEQYAGNYFNVVADISARIEKENRKNAMLAKEIQQKKEQANKFAFKGGQMRLVAKRMRDLAAELEEEKVDIRKEDKTIRHFTIPFQADLVGVILRITSYTAVRNHKTVTREADISLHKNNRLLLMGPNGTGKTTLLESIALGTSKGAVVTSGVRIGYYRQDFSMLNFEDTVYDSLSCVMEKLIEEDLRAAAANFLITGDLIRTKIGNLSEGQKGLVALARLVLQKPGLLVLDEPTNHMNFRHIPVIAEALNKYQGALVLVSHVPEFVQKIRIDEVLDLEK